jgi:superfamily II DNA or RNA helicase
MDPATTVLLHLRDNAPATLKRLASTLGISTDGGTMLIQLEHAYRGKCDLLLELLTPSELMELCAQVDVPASQAPQRSGTGQDELVARTLAFFEGVERAQSLFGADDEDGALVLARGYARAFWAELRYDKRAAAQPPRPYQALAVETVLGTRRVTDPRLIYIATGGGKTRVGNDIATSWQQQTGRPVYWISKDWWLLLQALTDLRRRYRDYPVGRIGGERQLLRPLDACSSEGIVYTTAQTLVRRLEDLAECAPSLLIWDECHWGEHAGVGEILSACKQLGIQVVGLTATPRDRSRYEVVFQKTFFELVDEGYLARPIVADAVRTGVSWRPRLNGRTEDVAPDSLAELATNRRRNAAIVAHYAEHADEYGKTIVFACNKWHCNQLARLFAAKGIAALPIHSDLDQRTAREALRKFRSNAVQVLVNVAMLTHGIDVPDAKTVFLCRPTTSDVLLSQMIGRAARRDERTGKVEFNIVEFTDSVRAHGMFLKHPQDVFQGREGPTPLPGRRTAPRKRHGFDPKGAPTWIQATSDVPDSMKGLWYRRDQTFGIEFEITRPGPVADLDSDWLAIASSIRAALDRALPGRVAPEVLMGYSGGGFIQKDMTVWNVEYDASAGWEVTSPILANEDGFLEVDAACKALDRITSELNLTLDARTGTHVHLGWAKPKIGELKRAIQLAKLFEPAVATLVAPSRVVRSRRNSYDLRRPNRYCAPLCTVISREDLDEVHSVRDLLALIDYDGARYVTMNLRRLRELGTVEVRMHSGTLEARKILLWVSLWQQILWAATHRRRIEVARERQVLRPDGDIIALAMRYLPEARQAPQRHLLRRFAERREEVARGLWATHPALEGWLRYTRTWEKPSWLEPAGQ